MKNAAVTLCPLMGQVQGFMKLVAGKLDGTTRDLTEWFPNLITNSGLNGMGANGTFVAGAHVGTGSATPLVTDTALQSFLAGTLTQQSFASGVSGVAPYFGWSRVTFRFGVGAAAGNLTEVGMSSIGTTGGLFSRALILDLFGVPTTVTVLTDEYLDVSYELRCYAPDTTTSYSVVISGVTYAVQTRASRVTTPQAWAPSFTGVDSRPLGGSVFHIVTDGGLGVVTASPSGISDVTVSITRQPYSTNSNHRDFLMSASLDQANLIGGIRSSEFFTSVGSFQNEFNPKIPKDNTKVLSLLYRVSWARYSLGSP